MSILSLQRRIGILALVLVLTGCAADRGATTQTRLVTPPAVSVATAPFINVHALIIVRHGDIDVATKKTMGDQAPLTARGEERARELAYALKDAGITRIVTSETLRTHETAAVLAQELGLTLESPFAHGKTSPTSTMPATAAHAPSKKQEAANVLAYLAKTGKPEETVLLVHHHSVIPDLMKLLGYSAEPPYAEDMEFDRIYVLLPDPATHTYHILRLRYGGDWHQQ